MNTSAAPMMRAGTGFVHEGFVYRGAAEFLEGTTTFIRAALAAGEPMMVAVIAPKVELLRSALDGDADRVTFVDMAEVGRNPARIIPAWRRFVDENLGPDCGIQDRAVRGIGEPIWDGRRDAEIAEGLLHEALLNLAFDDGPRLWLRCAYDAVALGPAVVDAVEHSHPVLLQDGTYRDSLSYTGPEQAAVAFAGPLPEPADWPKSLYFGPGGLASVREMVTGQAAEFRLGNERTCELVLAVHELATNSLRYGGEWGALRVWVESGALVAEVSDRGRIEQPLVGRSLPAPLQDGGRGLWLANQLCDLVQIRSSATGTVVRIHMWR